MLHHIISYLRGFRIENLMSMRLNEISLANFAELDSSNDIKNLISYAENDILQLLNSFEIKDDFVAEMKQ